MAKKVKNFILPNGEEIDISGANEHLSNLSEVGADKLNTSKMYTTGGITTDVQGFKQLQQMRYSTFDLSKFTVVGSPTITDDGVLEGISDGNYLKINNDFGTGSWHISLKFNITSYDNLNPFLYLDYSNGIYISDLLTISVGGWGIDLFPTYSFDSFELNTDYLLDIDFDGISTHKAVRTNLNTGVVDTDSYTSEDKFVSGLHTWDIGKDGTRYFNGSIDLKHFSITVDGKEVFSGNKTGLDIINNVEIPYTLSKTGSKIVDVAYRDRVIDLYEQEGQAGYYTIDVSNKNFTLPMGEVYGMIEEAKNKGGSGLEVCDIGTALYVDETKGLRRYLNGQIVDRNTNTEAFFTRLQDITTLHPSLLCTEDEWQTAKTMSAFGQVGKFVFNYSSDEIVSVRIPAIVNVQGLFDLQNLGMTVEAGLPNIKGNTTIDIANFNTNGASGGNGAITQTYKANHSWAGNNRFDGTQIKFDASRSNPIYGNSNTVQPEAIQFPYFIQIATGSETENNIINGIELNNPYSLFDSKYSDHELNNLSWLKSEGQWNAKAVYPTAYDKLLKVYNGTETIEGLSVKLSTETYTDYDFVLNTAEETFRLPLKTKLASGNAVVGNGMTLGLTDGTTGSDSSHTGLRLLASTATRLAPAWSSEGKKLPGTDFSSLDVSDYTLFGVDTNPEYSGIELSDSGLYLYFYVGETVQNANLIDAGRIGEQLANLITVVETYQNGASWYRVYSDGWCEQGGRYNSGTSALTVKLLKTFANINYTASASLIGSDGAYLSRGDATLSTFTPSSFRIDYKSTTPDGVGTPIGYFWQASGYIR